MAQLFMINMATQAATKLLGRTFDDLYDFLKDKATLTIDKTRVQRRIPDLVSRINSFRMVKTLWQMERPVDVEEFYCASNVLIPTNTKSSRIAKQTKRKRKKIDVVSDFGSIGNIVIKGIAGQGKSIFLRHLLIREFEQGQRIPVFIELRKIREGESLLDHVTRFLDILDLKIDTRIFRILARSGKFVFFLDAFDEIPEKEKHRIFNQLEFLALSSPGSQFIVTTRPHSSVEMSTLFTVTTLDYLINKEYQSVIRKLSANNQFANSLIKAIKEHKSTLSDLLCTPLLVTLLIIEYASFQRLPEQMPDFYESIFDVLLQRHDQTKPGFVRQRLCSLNDHQYRHVFNAFCFESMKIDKSELLVSEIKKAISKAMQAFGIDEDPINFLKDISRVTCLVLHEGEEYRFIHKTVQEYYAASFIESRPDHLVSNFYSACKSDYFIFFKWNQVLEFLSDIDKYRYYKYYLIPLCHKWLDVDDDKYLVQGFPTSTPELTKRVLGGFIIGLESSSDNAIHSLNLDTLSQILPEVEYLDLFELDYSGLLSQIKNNTISINRELFKRNYFESILDSKLDSKQARRKQKELEITVEQIFEEGFFVNELTSLATRIIHDIYDTWKQAYSYIKREESLDITSDIGI